MNLNKKVIVGLTVLVICIFSGIGVLCGLWNNHIQEMNPTAVSESSGQAESFTKTQQETQKDKTAEEETAAKKEQSGTEKETDEAKRKADEEQKKAEEQKKIEEQALLLQKREAFSISTDSVLYSYEQMTADLQMMGELYPEYVTVESVGTTADQRELWMATIGNAQASRHVFVQASIHAREYVNTLITMKSIEYYLKNYQTGSYQGVNYEELFSQVCFHIIPMSNPDGVTISQSGPEAIRDEGLRQILYQCYQSDLAIGKASGDSSEYWRLWKANARGVDLNRNFNSGWEMYEGTTGPSSDHYKGEAYESELETQAIVRVMKAYPTAAVISNHSMGNLIYWDCGSQGTVHEIDYNLAVRVSEVTGFEPVSSSQSNQDAAGCGDYAILNLGIPEVTIESGSSSCPIGIEEFDTLWNANRDVWPAVAQFCMS